MRSSSSPSMFVLLLSHFHFVILVASSSFVKPICREDETLALLQFKQSFEITEYASGDPSAYPKVDSWMLKGNNTNCCFWDGVECDEYSGHVIGLDLNSSLLYGSINSNSSLFRLVHLQRLNLADNHLNYSKIPSAIGRFSSLNTLDLSQSVFSGEVPQEIAELSKLVTLDLSENYDDNLKPLLKLERPTLMNLVHNLTGLKVLSLSQVKISSQIPHILGNLSSLTTLSLRECELYGEFPISVFHLPKMQTLSIRLNQNLTGYLPEFRQGSPLEILRLSGTRFSGKIPDSIGNLKSLKALNLSYCNFTGSIPSTIGDLIDLEEVDLSFNHLTGEIPPSFSNLTQLVYLYLNDNNLASKMASWIGNQRKLTYLSLSSNNFHGEIPSSMCNLTQLTFLNLYINQLTGEIPSCLGNLTQLTNLEIDQNELHGPISKSIFKLVNLNSLSLALNNLSGTLDANLFLQLKDLKYLFLSASGLSLLHQTTINSTVPKLNILGLRACNLYSFPEFLKYQDELEWLDISANNIHGQIPKWIFNVGKRSLLSLIASFNSLTGFEQLPSVLPWERLQRLRLDSNFLQGSLPIPPLSTIIYNVANNLLMGGIPELICNSGLLEVLDLSNNSLSGIIPKCDSLLLLDLGNNNFHGTIPQLYNERCKLQTIDLSRNHFDGPLFRSLANCTMLENLNLGNNHITDTFPIWLRKLPELKILLLRSNEFHGVIEHSLSNFDFPKLRIIDLSNNSFTGELPSRLFQNWNGTNAQDVHHPTYVQIDTSYRSSGYWFIENFAFFMTFWNKGTDMQYSVVQTVFTAIDLSSNKFGGNIPESIGNLKGVQLLNLSNNDLTGPIPSSLGELRELEALDLSRNELSGHIPQQLIELTFLAFFDVSHNHLSGAIPRGNQFDTFDNISYDWNSGLCGDPLSKKCGSSPPQYLTDENEDFGFSDKIDWIFICMGCASGLVVGWIMGNVLTTSKHSWFLKTFARRNHKRKGRMVR